MRQEWMVESEGCEAAVKGIVVEGKKGKPEDWGWGILSEG